MKLNDSRTVFLSKESQKYPLLDSTRVLSEQVAGRNGMTGAANACRWARVPIETSRES